MDDAFGVEDILVFIFFKVLNLVICTWTSPQMPKSLICRTFCTFFGLCVYLLPL